MNKNELIDRYKKVVSPVLGHYNDLEIKGGKGSYLFGIDGKNYLDFSCGIAVTSLGHSHPAVSNAVKKQVDNLTHICIGVAYYEKFIELAEKITSLTPGLDMCIFSQDGSGAVEGAIKLAKYVSKKSGIISFKGGFHGRSFAAMSVTTSKEKYSKGYEPLMANVYHAPYPYCFRCMDERGKKQSLPDCGFSCISKLEEAIKKAGKENIAAMIIEPVLGEGGYIVPPDGYLKKIREICDRDNILLIFDEVQTGFARTGKFFAYEHFGVVPDILCLAKAIANGLPLGAVVARKSLMEKWSVSTHGGTYGGNPVCCAASLAVIETMQKEKLAEKATETGAHIVSRLKEMQEKSNIIGDIRGLGMMIGVEIVNEKGDPDHATCMNIMKECLNNGLLMINCGIYDNVIRLIPPLNISRSDVDKGLNILEGVICKK